MYECWRLSAVIRYMIGPLPPVGSGISLFNLAKILK
jgi:hypothetical protein